MHSDWTAGVSVLLNRIPAAHEAGGRNRSTPERILHVHRNFGPEQGQVLSCDRRFIVLAAGRRWGKTTLGLYQLLCHAARMGGQLCYYLAPTEDQAKEIAWRSLKEMVPPSLTLRTRESDLEIELVNHSLIKLHGPRFLRGAGLDFVVLDEFATCLPISGQRWFDRCLRTEKGGRSSSARHKASTIFMICTKRRCPDQAGRCSIFRRRTAVTSPPMN